MFSPVPPPHAEQSFGGAAVAHGNTTKSQPERQPKAAHGQRRTEGQTVGAPAETGREGSRGEDLTEGNTES